MKEVMAFIRANKVNITKETLANGGFPAFTCRKCLGRGKKGINSLALDAIIAAGQLPQNEVGEHLTEATRLIAKRVITLIVNDEDVEKVVKLLITANQTGNPGDGKIFVLPIYDSYKVRSGEQTADAY